MLNVLLAAATFHDKSKVPFFIAAGVLVAWALLVSAFGIRSDRFATSSIQGRAVMGISAVLVVVTAAMGIVTAKTPPPAHPYDTSAVTNGVAPTITPIGAASSGATGASTPPSSSSGGALALAANPSGQLAYDTKTLTAASGNVTIDFTNKSPLPHNVTIANAGGKVLGATPTFTGGEKTLKLNLPPGTYTFYCSVPGHEQAGMKGTLTVSAGGASSGATGTTSPSGTTSGGALALAANPSGQLAYDAKTLTASSSHVTIDFTNKSPLPHNVTIANASGKVVGATPTFTAGEKTLKLNLPPGTYTFYCSVPGHEQAGMKGTLTVR